MRIEAPIIIVGTGRCGSTMLHRLIALHEEVGWFSTFNEVFPAWPWLSRFSNLYRRRFLGRRIRHLPCFPKPFEAYRFWEHYLPGFSRRDAPLTADDVPEDAIAPVREVISRILAAQGRRRLLVKVTGWSRMTYFDRIFPDALFVSLHRERRSVISSWIRAGWLDVTSEPDTAGWQWGEVPEPYRRLWRELGGGPLLSAAVKTQLDIDDIRRNGDRFSGRFYELRYEELITRPEEELRELLDFCGLEWTESFARVVDGMTFHNPIDKWREHLSDAEGDRIVEFVRRAEGSGPVATTARSEEMEATPFD